MRFSDDQIQTMDEWRFCPMANFICPTARCTKNEVHTPRGLAFTAFRVHRGDLAPEPSVARFFYECSTGGLCATKALDGTDVPALVRAVRVNLVEDGHAPIPVGKVRERLLRFESLDGSDSEPMDGGSAGTETLLVGSPWLTQAHAQQHRAAAALMEQAGVAFSVPAEPVGSPGLLYELGYLEDARSALQKLFEVVEAAGPKRVVFPSPYGLRAIRTFAPELGLDPSSGVEWLSAATWIGSLLEEGCLKIGKPMVGRIGLLEPSYAVHEVGSSNEPLFERVVAEPVTLRWPGDTTRTCGGATLSAVYPDLAAAVMARTAEEAMVHRTVERFVSSCPFVVTELRASGLGIEATDLLTLMDEVVGG
jgi:Fe-S oxidoreductase